MSLSTGRYQIADAFKILKQEWESMENIWRDSVRKEFDLHYWEPLSIRIAALLTAMDRLDHVLFQMRRDCE